MLTVGERTAFGDFLDSAGTLTFDLPKSVFLALTFVTLSYFRLLPFLGSQQQVISCPLSLSVLCSVTPAFCTSSFTTTITLLFGPVFHLLPGVYTYIFKDMFKM